MDLLKDGRKKNWFYLENNVVDRLDLSIYEKIAYMVLARHSDAEGISFPSYKTLALKMGCSERKAKDTISDLLLKNLILKENRCDPKNNAFTSNVYLIKEVPSAPDAQPLVHDMHNPSAPDAQPPVHDMHNPSARGALKGNSFKETHFKETNINIYSAVVDYLNAKANTVYKASSRQTKTLIDARLKEGFELDDFKKVIDSKAKDWLKTDFEKYLRPSTLFGNKFEGYLNQKGASTNASDKPSDKGVSEWEQSELEKARKLASGGNADYSEVDF